MGFESFIARRYLKSGRRFISVSTWITVLGVTLGVAAVCFVVSMHNGFEAEIRTRLLGTTSHVTVFPEGNDNFPNYREIVDTLETVDNVVAASAFIYSKVAISRYNNSDGIIIRGIIPEQERRTSTVAESIISGAYDLESRPVEDDTLPGILLGYRLAHSLEVGLDEIVMLHSVVGEEIRSRARPRVAYFRVAGLLETGMYEFDAQLAYISLTECQKLFQLGDVATTVHLKLTDVFLADEMAPILDSVLGPGYDVKPWKELNQSLFAWIELEKLGLFLGFLLIVLVAGFSIVSTLVMLTMEKRTEIGILKTIGSTPMSILRVFIMNGVFIAVFGVGAGWSIAYAAAYIQNTYQVISIPADVYFINYLPIEAHAFDFIIVGLCTFVICLLASLYPAYQASRVSVISVLRQ